MKKILLFIAFIFSSYGQQKECWHAYAATRFLYLDLIKKTILNTIYEPADFKKEGTLWPVTAHSMIGEQRMNMLQWCSQEVLEQNVPGDFIEAGVWRGGATIFMRAMLKAYLITDRKVWVADSFCGLPVPNEIDFPQDKECTLHYYNYLAVSLDEVKQNFAAYDLLDEQVMFLPGFFKDTMSYAREHIDSLAILRLDGDMYESTMQVLDALYDKVSLGGYIIIDDYALPGARQAVDDFRAKRHIQEGMIAVDYSGVFWQKRFY